MDEKRKWINKLRQLAKKHYDNGNISLSEYGTVKDELNYIENILPESEVV